MADNADAIIARRKSPGRPAFKYGPKAVSKLYKNKTVDYKHRLEAIIKVSEIGITRKKVHGWVGSMEEVAGDVSVLDDDTLADLFTNLAIEDAIDSDEDIDGCEEPETSEPN
ncbi:hypothetical protein DYB32_008667 [Aphanomyces invadans]|uniref:Uncharacterized protein n=1 Tax=Aphanomyces invadans TaxID=157072 RepID=A0A3R7A400_9STRA|nr:hypothetical protein DYB32_008667 [Aphanomyces invadans]